LKLRWRLPTTVLATVPITFPVTPLPTAQRRRKGQWKGDRPSAGTPCIGGPRIGTAGHRLRAPPPRRRARRQPNDARIREPEPLRLAHDSRDRQAPARAFPPCRPTRRTLVHPPPQPGSATGKTMVGKESVEEKPPGPKPPGKKTGEEKRWGL